ncbi:MAG TPA: hypothetical protein VFS19_02605, partial [Planctomycetota bacterium]|nr:hypothetical protein [Planctomycetota bacterium]
MLLALSLKEKTHPETVALLTELERDFKQDIRDFETNPDYADFKKSQEYKDWMKSRAPAK